MHIIREIINQRSMNLVFIRAGLLTSPFCQNLPGLRGGQAHLVRSRSADVIP